MSELLDEIISIYQSNKDGNVTENNKALLSYERITPGINHPYDLP